MERTEERPGECAMGVEGLPADETVQADETTGMVTECGRGAGGWRSGGLWERFNGGVGGESGGVADL